MHKEFERGRQDAIKHLSETDVVRVKRSELNKLSTLLYAFLEANPDNKITPLDNVAFNRHAVIRNMDDINYVLGYLKGLT